MNKKRLLTTTCLIGLLLMPFFVHAEKNSGTTSPEIEALNQQIEQKRAKVKELEASIEAYKKKIEQKQTEAASFE